MEDVCLIYLKEILTPSYIEDILKFLIMKMTLFGSPELVLNLPLQSSTTLSLVTTFPDLAYSP